MPKYRFSQLIAKSEGFGVPGTIPTIRHDPGDLRHSPHSSHVGIGPDDIGIIDTDADGWADLEHQLDLIAKDYPGITIYQTIGGERDDQGEVLPRGYPGWAPAADKNNVAAYVNTVATGLGLAEDDSLANALKVPAI